MGRSQAAEPPSIDHVYAWETEVYHAAPELHHEAGRTELSDSIVDHGTGAAGLRARPVKYYQIQVFAA